MNRTELLNYLIQEREFKSYLEIGVSDEQYNFSRIECAVKIGVDPKPVTTFQGTSDAFFAQNQAAFDLIFIDGLHTEEQVLKDIMNACAYLAESGLIVLHDCLPPDAWHQRELEEFEAGENWNGQVWKAILRFFNRTTYQCVVVDIDWGCGIIDTSKTQAPADQDLPERLDYPNHFDLLLPYRISLAAYLRAQVTVFYHLACMGNWQEVFVEQMQQLRQSGFRQVNLTLLGSGGDWQTAHDVCQDFDLLAQLVFRASELTHFETPSLRAIEVYAQQHPGYVLYLHSKGVSNPGNSIKTRWRQLMMHELVEKWQQCALQLPYYDVVGVNWRDMGSISHFSGNFWYASTRYLRTLVDFSTYYAHPQYQIWDAINDKRLGCEFWIGSSKPARILSLVCRNKDFCSEEYWKIFSQALA